MKFKDFLIHNPAQTSIISGMMVLSNSLTLIIPLGMGWVIDVVLPNQSIRDLFISLAVLLGICVTKAYVNYWRYTSIYHLAEGITCSLRERLFYNLQRKNILDLRKNSVSVYVTKLVGDVENVKRFVIRGIFEWIYSSLTLAILLSALFYLNFQLAFITLISLAVLGYFCLLNGSKLKSSFSSVREMTETLVSKYQESLQGIETIRAFWKHREQDSKMRQIQAGISQTTIKANRMGSKIWISTETISMMGIICIFWIGTYYVMKEKISLGELIAFYAFFSMLIGPIVQASMILSQYHEANTSLKRIDELLKNNPDELIDKGKNVIEFSSRNAPIEFSRVHFSYHSKSMVLKDCSFRINHRDKVALIGPSGFGKSTIIHLMMRFYQPFSGKIRMNGIPSSETSLLSYLSQVGFISQDEFLFDDTLMNNLLFESTPHREQLEWVKSFLGIDQIALGLSQGYESRLGENGIRLSKGQRQRLTFARALNRNPDLYIMDEPLSAIEADQRYKILNDLFNGLLESKTVVFSTHDHRCAQLANRILKVDKGIVEELSLFHENPSAIL